MNHGMETSLPPTVLFSNDAREEGFDLVVFEVLLQINCVRGQNALPDNIDHENVDIAAFCRPVLLE